MSLDQTQPYADNFIAVIPLEQGTGTRHTERDPFCFDDPTCPCHEDQAAIALVHEQVQAGLLTEEEATRTIAGHML